MRVCIPVAEDGLIDPRWGRAHQVAIVEVSAGLVSSWQEHEVGWDIAHDSAGEGAHHAAVARFLRDEGVDTVVAHHMGPPMSHMLERLGIRVLLGASGPAREAVTTVSQA